MKQTPRNPMPKPRRARLLQVRISDLEKAALSEQAVNENLASLSDYIRKAALDRAGYRRLTPTQLKP